MPFTEWGSYPDAAAYEEDVAGYAGGRRTAHNAHLGDSFVKRFCLRVYLKKSSSLTAWPTLRKLLSFSQNSRIFVSSGSLAFLNSLMKPAFPADTLTSMFLSAPSIW
jgi:hypothetical protein